MWLRDPLNDILSCATKVAVLRTMCEVGSPLSGREAIGRAGVTYGPGWAALQALAASGVLSVKDYGRAKTYELRDPQLPLVQRLRDLFAAERDRRHEAIRELADRVPEIVALILFGSEARGEARPGSDTDVLIVVFRRDEEVEARVRGACLEVAERHGLALSWQVTDPGEIRDWQAGDDEFWRNVMRDGVWLHGGPSEVDGRRWQTGKPI